MLKRLRHMLLLGTLMTILVMALGMKASAFTYQSVPSNLDLNNFRVTIGGVTLPLEEYPEGAVFDPQKSTMTAEEAAKYGISQAVDLRGWTCVGFARYVYTALYYQYPADATIDTSLAYDHGNSYAYRNMIYEVLGTKTLASGYSASTLKNLITSCYPGAVMRVDGHSMVIMAIFNEGFVIYDANFSNTNEVDTRYYSWDDFVSSLGSRNITAVQIPSYYPGYRYSTGVTGGGVDEDYTLDTSAAGIYEVVNVSSSLNVRSAPSQNGSIVGRIRGGETVVVRGTYGAWAAIEYDGAVCWAHMDYLAYSANQTDYPLDTADAGSYQVYNCVELNIRSGPSVSTQKMGTLPAGTVVEVLGSYDGWAAFDFEGKTCWGYMIYLTPYESQVNVTFDANGGSASYTNGIYQSGVAFGTLPTAEKENRTFGGWFNGNTKYTENSIVPAGSDLALQARWSVLGFTDAYEDQFYTEAVEWAVANQVAKGMTETTFEPETECQRGHVITFLWRAMGCPEPTATETCFTDVDPNQYYYKALLWAVENEIAKGMTETTFEPETICTRAQVVTFLWRAMGCPEPTITESVFTDVDPNEYYYKAMLWAVEHGVTNGMTPTEFEPETICIRAHVVTFLYRMKQGA